MSRKAWRDGGIRGGMIDVWGVLSNSLWILGLAVLLAVWSYASYQASRTKQKIRTIVDKLHYALILDAGLLLCLLGMATTEDRWWARALWLIISAGVVAEGVWRIVEYRRATSSSGEA